MYITDFHLPPCVYLPRTLLSLIDVWINPWLWASASESGRFDERQSLCGNTEEETRLVSYQAIGSLNNSHPCITSSVRMGWTILNSLLWRIFGSFGGRLHDCLFHTVHDSAAACTRRCAVSIGTCRLCTFFVLLAFGAFATEDIEKRWSFVRWSNS